MVLQRRTDCVRTVLTQYAFFARLAAQVQNVPLQSQERALRSRCKHAIAARQQPVQTSGPVRFSFYEESPRVKPPVAGLRLRWAGHFLSCKRYLRWLARFDCECERDSLVTTFYPCRRGRPSTRCCIRPKRARRTGFGRSTPSIRTAAHIARPRKITGASTNLQRCKLLSLTALGSQICEAMSRASSGITPSAR